MNYLRSSSHYMWSTTDVLGKGATGSVFKGVHKVSLQLNSVMNHWTMCYE